MTIDRLEERRPAGSREGNTKCPHIQGLRMAGVAVCILFVICAINVSARSSRIMAYSSGNDDGQSLLLSSSSSSSSSHNYSPASDARNKLLTTFEKLISNATLRVPPGYDSYVPFLLNNDGRTLCRRSHMDLISKTRANSVLEMIALGIRLQSRRRWRHFSNDIVSMDDENSPVEQQWGGLPVIVLNGDGSGCFHRDHGIFLSGIRDSHGPFHGNGPVDRVPFPRLTWHAPSPKHGTGWCNATCIPGYEPWRLIRDLRISNRYSWGRRFMNIGRRYPWRTKIEMAVWRGSTTGFWYPTFDDLPRAKLVKAGAIRSDIFDVGFTSFVMGWEEQMEELWNYTRVANYISYDDLMKYRAIIDIDGNTWSSRFPKLLCTNSVIIKVRGIIIMNHGIRHVCFVHLVSQFERSTPITSNISTMT
jgi:hypothetical protein